jgi:serine/threonine protein kinase
LYGTTSDGDYTYLLLQYLPRGSLTSFLKSEDKRALLNALTRVNMLCGIAQAMHFLHSGGVKDESQQKYDIFHRDIKSDNICLNERLNPVLIDFGITKFTPRANYQEQDFSMAQTVLANTASIRVVGTPSNMCPQYKSGKIKKYDVKCDVYSFGVVREH